MIDFAFAYLRFIAN